MTTDQPIKRIHDTLVILKSLGLPKAQQNERSALTLLALLNLTPDRAWDQAENPLIGITPIMDWIKEFYQKNYAPNTRETIRRQTMHQFLQAGIVEINPDAPKRPINSPKTVYRIVTPTLSLIKLYDSDSWNHFLELYLSDRKSLTEQYAREREQLKIPLQIANGTTLQLSPGEHSGLIKDIVMEFGPRYAPGSKVVYLGDTGEKMGFIDHDLLMSLNIDIDMHGKMPDVILYLEDKEWLLLIEAVTSHGPVDAKRHEELTVLFGSSSAGLVFVTAFPTRSVMSRYLSEIAWETEVWIAEAPSHLIHFNGERFLGPYSNT